MEKITDNSGHLIPVVIKTYSGNQNAAIAKFEADAADLAKLGYAPTSQTWTPGSYGCGAFLLALLLCIVFIGVLVFIYMLIVKPDGALTVTYKLHQVETDEKTANLQEKVCPRCAETVKAAAQICRFCGHEFFEAQ